MEFVRITGLGQDRVASGTERAVFHVGRDPASEGQDWNATRGRRAFELLGQRAASKTSAQAEIRHDDVRLLRHGLLEAVGGRESDGHAEPDRREPE